jgi:hypothetical protein
LHPGPFLPISAYCAGLETAEAIEFSMLTFDQLLRLDFLWVFYALSFVAQGFSLWTVPQNVPRKISEITSTVNVCCSFCQPLSSVGYDTHGISFIYFLPALMWGQSD